MKFVNFFVFLCFSIFHVSSGLKIVSKTNFDDAGSTETTESNSGSKELYDSDSAETTTREYRSRIKPEKLVGLKNQEFDAQIPVSIKESGKEYQLKIPVKIEEKKEKPKQKVKFYKGTKVENKTAAEKPERDPVEEQVPIVKGSFSDVKPDFLVPIPKETVPSDIHSLSPLNDFRNYFKFVAGRLRAGKPEYIEGLHPPPPPNGRPYRNPGDPWSQSNCSTYSGMCYPSTDGYPYPDVGSDSPLPRPTYGVPTSGNDDWQRPNDHGNDWNQQRPGSLDQGGQHGNDWGGSGWSQNQGNQKPWNPQNPGRPPINQGRPPPNQNRPVYGPPDPQGDGHRPWGVSSQGGWNRYEGRPGLTDPVRLNSRRGSWISCRPFEIQSGRETREEPSGCPQKVPFAVDLSAVTPASKIDDKTLFNEENKTTQSENEARARFVFPS